MNEWKNEVKPNGTAGEFQSDSKQNLHNTIKKSPVGGSKLDQLIKIKGTTTSRIEVKTSTDTPAYCFLKEDCATCFSEKARCYHPTTDTPIIFRIKENNQRVKPNLKKGSWIELTGNWAKSNGNRPSFTATAYQITSDPPKINCFYNSRPSPCSFTTPESQAMEKHYKKEHYPQAKEVYRG